jgi:hypothetical protein
VNSDALLFWSQNLHRVDTEAILFGLSLSVHSVFSVVSLEFNPNQNGSHAHPSAGFPAFFIAARFQPAASRPPVNSREIHPPTRTQVVFARWSQYNRF